MKAYLSSTYRDLVEFRDTAYKTLRALRVDVIAMEDYVATDERPVDRCLADVEAADVYIGLFAFRYGYVPPMDNPEQLSITEMEYRHAVALGKPRLLFLVPLEGLHKGTKWELRFLDAMTGEGDAGQRITRLREELGKERIVKEFTTPDQLQSAVSISVANWLLAQRQPSPAGAAGVAAALSPHPRELRVDLLLVHAPVDAESAAQLTEALSGLWRIRATATGMTATSRTDLGELDRLAATARSAAVLLTPGSLTSLAEDRAASRRALDTFRDRTGEVIGLVPEYVDPGTVEPWGLTRLVGPPVPTGAGMSGLATLLHRALVINPGQVTAPEVGLPVVTVAMTGAEAETLLADPPPPVAALLTGDADRRGRLVERYGRTRMDWRPFADSPETVQQVLTATVVAINQGGDRLRGRSIRLQTYPFDHLVADDALDYWSLYRDIAQSGCLVVVDELSLFHEPVRDAFATSPLATGTEIAFVTLSPLDPAGSEPHVLLRDQLDGYLTYAARRFGESLDPLCELGVPERRRLERWLRGSLPRAVETLREPKQDPDKLRDLAEELGRRPNPALGRLVAGEVGQG